MIMLVLTSPILNIWLNKLLLILLCTLFLPAPLLAQRGLTLGNVKTLPSSSKRYALVIGVDRYADTQITTLGGAANDAQALADALVQYAGFTPENVILLSSTQPAERQPTRGNILRRLSNLSTVIPKDGMLLISFAGHGMERAGEAFLLPADAQVSDDVDLLEQTAINVEQVRDKIKRTGVGQVLLFLDACRNDPAGRADAPNPLTRAYTENLQFDTLNSGVQAFATLYATSIGQRAYEYKERGQGYFTWAIVEGLKGAAANERGEVTLAGLVKYLQDRVPKKVLLDLGQGKQQIPYAEIGGYKADELIISLTIKPVIKNPMVEKTGEAVFWESIKESKDADDFRAYLKVYPLGQFAGAAREKLTSLQAALVTTTNSTPINTPELIDGIDELGLAGTWSGSRGMIDERVIFLIKGSRGDAFFGEMRLKGFRVAVSGRLNQKTRQVTMKETEILKIGEGMDWKLSNYSGTLSRDGTAMSGTIFDRTNDNAGYAWSFSRE